MPAVSTCGECTLTPDVFLACTRSHLTAFRIFRGVTRGPQNCAPWQRRVYRIARGHLRIARGDGRRSSELHVVTAKGLQNFARRPPRVFRIACPPRLLLDRAAPMFFSRRACPSLLLRLPVAPAALALRSRCACFSLSLRLLPPLFADTMASRCGGP